MILAPQGKLAFANFRELLKRAQDDAKVRAGLFTASYFLVIFLPEIEEVVPALSRYLPVVLVAFLIFCSQAGLKPISFTRRVKNFLSKRE